MGLVGSLEDLGLGDILQIVSLARKSGVLNLSSGEVKGKIIFKDGLVISALSSEIKGNLGLMLVREGVIIQGQLEQVLEEARRRGEKGFLIKGFLVERFGIEGARVDLVIQQEIENVVFSFFTWGEGNFSFELMEVEEEINALKNPWRQFILEQGLSPQYLAMEGTRLQDERRRVESGPLVGAVAGEDGLEIKDEEFKVGRGGSEEDFSSVAESLNQVPTKRSVPEEEKPDFAGGRDFQGEQFSEITQPVIKAVKVEKAKVIEKEGLSVVVVDDDPLLLDAIEGHFSGRGYRVEKFLEIDSGVKRVEQLYKEKRFPIVVGDLIMPSSGERGLLGGIELLKKIKGLDVRIPCIIITDYENQPAEKQAEKLGVNYFFFKPKSSQIDESFSSPELLNFLQVLDNAFGTLRKVVSEIRPELGAVSVGSDELFDLAEALRKELGDEELIVPEVGERKSRGLEMLKNMIQELNDPSSNGQITLMVLRFAAELMNRAVIFVVAKDQVAGLGQFGIILDGKDPERQVRRMRIPLDEPSIFQEAIQKRIPLKKKLKSGKWNQYLIDRLGGIEPKEVFVAPIITSGKVGAILYGDNLPEQKEIGDTESLEIFLVQVGLAMEKALLERRLRELRKGEESKEESG